jgi:hypothetical protein
MLASVGGAAHPHVGSDSDDDGDGHAYGGAHGSVDADGVGMRMETGIGMAEARKDSGGESSALSEVIKKRFAPGLDTRHG